MTKRHKTVMIYKHIRAATFHYFHYLLIIYLIYCFGFRKIVNAYQFTKVKMFCLVQIEIHNPRIFSLLSKV